jgi:molybdopterin-guanine dinucleotide biosynthesis protein A
MKKYTVEEIQKTTNPIIIAEVLKRGKNDVVSCYAAKNPHCPPEALSEVLKRGKDDWVSQCAAKNPHCPPEALSEVLKRGKDDWVSWSASYNPHCPPEAKKMHPLRICIKQHHYTQKDLQNLLKQF